MWCCKVLGKFSLSRFFVTCRGRTGTGSIVGAMKSLDLKKDFLEQSNEVSSRRHLHLLGVLCHNLSLHYRHAHLLECGKDETFHLLAFYLQAESCSNSSSTFTLSRRERARTVATLYVKFEADVNFVLLQCNAWTVDTNARHNTTPNNSS